MTDLEKILAVNQWPLWPKLPLKRNVRGNDGKFVLELAVLFEVYNETAFADEGPSDYVLVEGANVWGDEKSSNLSKLPRVTAQDVVDAGWRVD